MADPGHDVSSATFPAAASAPAPTVDGFGHDYYLMVGGGSAAKIDNELDMIVNVTREYPFDYATVMFGYIMPFVLVVTLITNTLVVMVLAQRHMRTPTNIVLFTMAIVDLMTLLSPSPWYFYIYTLGYHDKFLYPPVACYAHHFMTDVIPVFFHTSSIWLALLLAGQRYIYVCHPSLASTWCTVPRVRRVIVIILVIAFVHQITRFFDNKFEPVSIQYNHAQHRACKNEIADWVQTLDIGLYYSTYYTFRIVFVFIIPCVALITLNCLLFRALRRAENKRSELLKTKFRLVGGNRSSAAGFEGRQSSFVGNSVAKNEPSNTDARASSGQHWPSRGRIGPPAAQAHRDSKELEERGARTAGRQEQRRKFSIASSFRLRRHCAAAAANKQQLFPADTYLESRSEVRSKLDDQMINGGRPVERETNSDGSSDRPARCAMKERGKQESRESNESYSAATNQSKSRLSTDGQSNGRDDDYTCPGCPVCERQQLEELKWCRRCLASAAATGDHQHQPVSQCSSLAGGATNQTNTTTNDEVSSCGNTHNISSSMCVAHDGTLDGIETASIRQDDEGLPAARRESTPMRQQRGNKPAESDNIDAAGDRNRKSVSADGDMEAEPELANSNSIDSRLVCGCASKWSPERRAPFRCTRTSSSRRADCRECCSSSRCRKQWRLRATNSSEQAAKPVQKCGASCSSSDPCIKCNNQTQDSSGCVTGPPIELGQRGADDKRAGSNCYADRCEAGCGAEPNKRPSNTDLYLDGNAAATTTTTTTLYSTQANSVASLLQAQQTGRQKEAAGASFQLESGNETHAKSPSFVSTVVRGSRATLIGHLSPPALVLAGGHQTVSLRSMDSNRTTLMLIVVVTVFLMVEVPVAIVTIIHVILNTFDAFKDVQFSAYMNYIKLFTNFFIMISYSVNFTIYCSMSKKFRETFRDLFLCGRQARRKRAAGLLYQQTQHSQYLNGNNNNNTNITNNNAGPNPNQLLAQEAGRCRGQSNNLNRAISDLASPAAQAGEQTNLAAGGQATLRYTTHRIRANSQQQECEL